MIDGPTRDDRRVSGDTRAVIETVVRIEFARVVGGLARYTGDVGVAEELAQDALVAALEQWPRTGTPPNPGAWLTTVGKRRAIDRYRRQRTLADKYGEIGRDLAEEVAASELEVDDAHRQIDDDILRLIFTACHPVLAAAARVALTLRMVGGLTTTEIARAHLVSEATIAQRIVRAKKTLAAAEVRFEVPIGDDRRVRLTSVLGVIYLIFNEGYSATAGDDWMRPELCVEAVRLGRMLVALMPEESEAHGLVALMEIQFSRVAARTGSNGEPILLLEQNRARWDRLLINRGFAALDRAVALGGQHRPYALQAEIAACHARAPRAEDTNWSRLASAYDVLAIVSPSPVVELNRAVAVSMAIGPQAGLDIVDTLLGDRTLAGYHLLPSVRGDLLGKLGRFEEAAVEFDRAATLTNNAREHELSMQRARDARALASRVNR